jgi:hypothetical protein
VDADGQDPAWLFASRGENDACLDRRTTRTNESMSNGGDAVIFKRKSKPATRTRERSPGVDEAGAQIIGDATVQESPSALANKLKSKSKRAKFKSKLSFGGGDEVCVSIASQNNLLIGVGGADSRRNRMEKYFR